MLAMKYQPPEKIATTNVVMSYHYEAAKDGQPRRTTGFVAENKVAMRGPNGFYAVRTARKAIIDPSLPLVSFNPFSFTQRLKDHFSQYADYTLSFQEVIQDFDYHEKLHEKRDRGYGLEKDTTHITAIPACVRQ